VVRSPRVSEDPDQAGKDRRDTAAAAVSGASEAPTTAADSGARPHKILVRVLLVLATVLAVFAIFAIWANRQLLNPDNWSRTSTALLQRPTIRSALSSYLVDQLYANVDVSGEIKSGLPSQLRPLAGPISGALHSVAEQGAEKALETPQVQGAWKNANRAADQTLVAIVKGNGHGVQIEGGTVTLNLREIVTDLAKRLGLPEDVGEKLPASVATLKVFTSSDLGLVRNAAKALHALAIWLTVLVFALYALAIYLARGRRRRTLMWVGASLALAGVLVLLGRKIGQGQVISAITSDASLEPAANDAYSVATSLLVQVATSSIIIGIPLVLAGWFAGPAQWAVSSRHFLAPRFRERPALIYWITAALLALIFIWGPIPATRNIWEMLIFTVLAFFGAYVLRGQIEEEFPDVQAVPVRATMGGYAHQLGEKVSHMRESVAPGGHDSTSAELERLAALHERGALTDQEFADAKRDLLAGS
jgi:hypothetical protein